MFRKFRRAFRAYPLTVEQQKLQICGGVDLGIFICSAGHWRNREKRWLFNENDNIDVNEMMFPFFAKVSVVEKSKLFNENDNVDVNEMMFPYY